MEMWHWCLAHIGVRTIYNMLTKDIVLRLAIMNIVTSGWCKDCIMGKHAQQPFDAVINSELASYEQVAFDI